MDYSPGNRILFPPNALISVPNPNYGDGRYYVFKANESGKFNLSLPRNEWIERKCRFPD